MRVSVVSESAATRAPAASVRSFVSAQVWSATRRSGVSTVQAPPACFGRTSPPLPSRTRAPAPPARTNGEADETTSFLNATSVCSGTVARAPTGNVASSVPDVRSGSVALSAAPQFAGFRTDVSAPPFPVHVAVAVPDGSASPGTRTYPSPSIQSQFPQWYRPGASCTPSSKNVFPAAPRSTAFSAR